MSRIKQAVVDSLLVLYQAGDYRTLAGRIRQLLESYPDELILHSLLGASLFELGEYDAATGSYRKALAIRPDFAKAHNSLGVVYLRMEQLEDALSCFRAAVHHQPRFAPAYYNIGIVCEHLRQLRTAAENYQKTIELQPQHFAAYTSLGSVLWELGEYDRVVACYRKALAIRHDYLPAFRNLLNFLEQSNRHAELKNTLVQARKALGDHPVVRLYEGIVADIRGDPAAARSILEDLRIPVEDIPGMHDERQRLARLVRICDRLDDTAATIRYAERANRLSGKLTGHKKISGQTFLEYIRYRREYFTEENITRWCRIEQTAGSPAGPVFIIGFPRSGTTLLDTILRSHPAIRIAEEAPAIPAVIDRLSSRSDNHLQSLAGMSASELEALRHDYFRILLPRVRKDGTAPLVIDRFALNIIYAGEIHRLFPQARFILVLRHPADCVFSCFMQSFYENPANANFFTLEDTAFLYDRVFDLWEQYRNLLPLDVMEFRYEDLIGDLEGACRPVLDFLDLPWHEALLQYRDTARDRKIIRTASYNQVTQPLYTDARGRWERYREYLQPVLPVLEPWIKKFGYPCVRPGCGNRT